MKDGPDGIEMEVQNPRAERTSDQDHEVRAMASGDEADMECGKTKPPKFRRQRAVNFEDEGTVDTESKPAKKRRKKRQRPSTAEKEVMVNVIARQHSSTEDKSSTHQSGVHERPLDQFQLQSFRRPFGIRNISLRPVMPKTFSTAAQSQSRHLPSMSSMLPASLTGAPYGVRRTISLPDRLNQQNGTVLGAPLTQPLPYGVPVDMSRLSLDSKDRVNGKKNISKVTAIILLLVSTGLVALCAEFLVASINSFVGATGVSEAFVGLIILPIVGNAAEHVTAVTVASKNKMDLAIGVAVGSSIQIGVFSALPLLHMDG